MINKIILGTAQFGLDYGINNKNSRPSVSDVFQMLDFATKSGVKLVDTADAYGTATKTIGEFLKRNPKAFGINTKFKKDGIQIKTQLNNSLDELNVEKVNTYFFHSFNDFLQYPQLIEELEELKKSGLIEKIGLSVYDNFELGEAIECDAIDTIQLPFNLLDNYSQRGKLLEQAKAKGKEIQARSVYLQGLFFMSFNELPYKLFPLKKYLKNLHELSVKNKRTMEMLALQYTIHQPFIDYVVIGVDNINQLEENINIANKKLLSKTIEAIDNINVKETELLYPKNWK